MPWAARFQAPSWCCPGAAAGAGRRQHAEGAGHQASHLLPQDRESLFYFNLREIPPRSDKPNSLQLALQTRIKFFYRPQSLVVEPEAHVAPGSSSSS